MIERNWEREREREREKQREIWTRKKALRTDEILIYLNDEVPRGKRNNVCVDAKNPVLR